MRALNRLAGLLLGLALLAGGLLALVDGALAAAGRHPWPIRLDRWYPALTGTRLHDPMVRTVAIGAAVLGLLILILQIRRWTPKQLALRPGDTGRWSVRRRSVERQLPTPVAELSGVNAVRARLRGRRARWRLTLRAEGRPESRDAIEHAVRDELDKLTAPDGARLRVTIRPPRRVA